MTTPRKLPSADNCAEEIAAIIAAHLNASIENEEEGSVEVPTDPIRAYARAVLEAAAEVQEKYGPIERSDEVAERIRALKEDL